VKASQQGPACHHGVSDHTSATGATGSGRRPRRLRGTAPNPLRSHGLSPSRRARCARHHGRPLDLACMPSRKPVRVGPSVPDPSGTGTQAGRCWPLAGLRGAQAQQVRQRDAARLANATWRSCSGLLHGLLRLRAELKRSLQLPLLVHSDQV